jgi:hypothetical protein
MEKEVNVLLEESATANVEKKPDLALDRAKKAAQKERKLGVYVVCVCVVHTCMCACTYICIYNANMHI